MKTRMMQVFGKKFPLVYPNNERFYVALSEFGKDTEDPEDSCTRTVYRRKKSPTDDGFRFNIWTAGYTSILDKNLSKSIRVPDLIGGTLYKKGEYVSEARSDRDYFSPGSLFVLVSKTKDRDRTLDQPEGYFDLHMFGHPFNEISESFRMVCKTLYWEGQSWRFYYPNIIDLKFGSAFYDQGLRVKKLYNGFDPTQRVGEICDGIKHSVDFWGERTEYRSGVRVSDSPVASRDKYFVHTNGWQASDIFSFVPIRPESVVVVYPSTMNEKCYELHVFSDTNEPYKSF